MENDSFWRAMHARRARPHKTLGVVIQRVAKPGFPDILYCTEYYCTCTAKILARRGGGSAAGGSPVVVAVVVGQISSGGRRRRADQQCPEVGERR